MGPHLVGAALRLFKGHGLGNDYLVMERGPALTPGLARRLCDRHLGPGADGVLEPFETPEADLGVRIWNPDGSLAEKSGNGLRIAAWWAHHTQNMAAHHTLHTGFERVSCVVQGDQIEIEMGEARFGSLLDDELQVGGDTLKVVEVSTGNPHAVVFSSEPNLDELPWRAWGALLEHHPHFPHRTNVQVARITGPSALEIRIHERGAGPTLASGSSSCGAAAAAVRTGRLAPGLILVRMPGGTLKVTVRPSWSLLLQGPVVPIGWVELHPDWPTS